MRFSTGVFVFDFSLAVVLALLGPWPFTFIGGLIAGGVLTYLYGHRVETMGMSWYSRFKRLDVEGRVAVESAFRDAERRIFGGR